MTLKKLQKLNPFITDYGLEVNEKDVEIANCAIRKMYRKPMQLTAGDVVQFTNEYGEFSPRAIIERVDGDEIHICQSGSAWCTDSKKYISVSGGSFFTISKSELVYLGRTKRNFSEWGRLGACASGAISIPVTVNLWRNKSKLKYTTEFYSQHYISPVAEEYRKSHNTTIHFSEFCKNGWDSNEELSAWCILNKGFIEKDKSSGNGSNHLVWAYKELNSYWNKDEDVLKMNGVHEFEVMNGAVRNVCYVYDDDKKTVTKFFGKDDLSDIDRSLPNPYRNWKKKHFQNTLKYIRENNIHFPESFIRG